MAAVQCYDAHHTFFSHDGNLLASIYDNELTVRRCKNLAAVQVFHFIDLIKAVKWSPDSKMVACLMPRRNLIEVFNVDSGEKVATLECFLSGGGRCFWGPSSCVLLVIEPYLLRALAWSLDDEACDFSHKVFNGLQPWAKPCVEFSPDGQWMAVVQGNLTEGANFDGVKLSSDNHTDGDTVALISAVTWRMSKRIECSGLSRVAGISWSPSSRILIIWSDEPSEPVLFSDIPSGEIITKWHPETNKYFVGLIQVCWSPSGQFVALMTYNDKVFILSSPKWKTLEVLACKEEIEFKECDIFHEVWEDENSLFDPQCVKLKERPVSISRLREDVLCPTVDDPSGNGSKMRRHCAWSSGGRYLAVSSVLAPAAVQIWDVSDGLVLNAVIVLSDRLLDFAWDPVNNTLAMCCGQQGVVVWSKEDGATCVPFDSDVSDGSSSPALRLGWSPSAALLIVGSERISRVLKIRTGSKNKNEAM